MAVCKNRTLDYWGLETRVLPGSLTHWQLSSQTSLGVSIAQETGYELQMPKLCTPPQLDFWSLGGRQESGF